jgi:hypothetical protein
MSSCSWVQVYALGTLPTHIFLEVVKEKKENYFLVRLWSDLVGLWSDSEDMVGFGYAMVGFGWAMIGIGKATVGFGWAMVGFSWIRLDLTFLVWLIFYVTT